MSMPNSKDAKTSLHWTIILHFSFFLVESSISVFWNKIFHFNWDEIEKKCWYNATIKSSFH
jgi:hypothetical protein